MDLSAIPNGYQLVRLGEPVVGEYYLARRNTAHRVTGTEVFTHPVAVLDRREEWARLHIRPTFTLPVLARFRNAITDQWTYGQLAAYSPGVMRWQDADGRWWRYAQRFIGELKSES